MQQTPFHAYYTARLLECLSDDDKLLPVFASSDIKVYPFQIAAANFALRSPYQKGTILCDESGMGKSHEAMLVIVQRWFEGQSRILLCIPNADLLWQWVEMIDKYYTIPYVVLTNREQWNENVTEDSPNAFEQDSVVITTYDFAVDQADCASAVNWDLTVFEEANALSSCFQEDNKQAKALKGIASDSFKLLLTGTPIEKNIMDLYGLVYFIDETILPSEKEFLQRYLRKPENYPELSDRVSKYCFRTLRSQAKQYAKIPDRILITHEYKPSQKERDLYNLLYAYCNRLKKLAFPEMNSYDLSLRLLDLQGSSTAAILQTIQGIIKRLGDIPNSANEIAELRQMETIAESIQQDEKTKALLLALDKSFKALKKMGANRKALIFTESIATQKYLYTILSQKHKTVLYNGSADYSAIKAFKADAEVLISTDNGARGFNLEETAFVVNYDLLFNTLKMEQRIDRCHRLNQENDVITLAFIDKNNFADVRKLELVNKRMLVTDGVFGITDEVIGGFTENLSKAMDDLIAGARTKEQVEAEYRQRLDEHQTVNKQIVSAAEDILFTTFTREIADKVRITPQYIHDRSEEINNNLWAIVKWYFERYNDTNTDCYFAIDDNAKTITAQDYEKLPHLFYYWSGSRNKPYTSLKSYGMAKDFKPHTGRITLSSVIGRGIIAELACGDSGKLIIDADVPTCTIALYSVTVRAGKGTAKEYNVLVGRTKEGQILAETECKNILQLAVVDYIESEHTSPHWLKGTGERYHELDNLVGKDELIQKQSGELSTAQAEEIEKIKLRAMSAKAGLNHALDDIQSQIRALEQEAAAVTNDRLKTLALTKKINALRQELMRKQENQFFDAMQLDLEVENKINEFLGREKLTAKAVRQFVINVEGK